ncbi:MAG: porin [Opitutales bacterium]|jgi:phosphate-selective porin OprO/OprP
MTETKIKRLTKAAALAAAMLTLAMPANALGAQSNDTELSELRAQIAMLQQRLEALEAREKQAQAAPQPVAATAPAAPAPAPDSVTVKLGTKGLVFATQDKQYSFSINTRVQADAHFFPDNADGTDEVFLRRAIVSFRGQAGIMKWRVSPNFASSVNMEDAWIELDFSDALHLTTGKLLSVEGLENFQSNAKLLFMERGLPNNMTPGREIGVKLDGKLGSSIYYGLSVTDGALDGNSANNNVNLSDEMLLSGLVKISPFAADKNSPLAGLTFGVSGSVGSENTSLDGSTDRSMKYKTSGRNTFLSVQTGTLLNGTRYRLNPQATWYYGSIGVLSEYILSSYEMSRGGVAQTVDNNGWTVQASYVLTGEANTFAGVKPAHPFSLGESGWGAFEVGMRYNVFTADKAMFEGGSATILAGSGSVQKASAIGASLKWHMTDNLLWALNYEVTDFSGLGADKDSEQALMTRLQIDF